MTEKSLMNEHIGLQTETGGSSVKTVNNFILNVFIFQYFNLMF